MIDDIDKTLALVDRMKAALPIRAFATKALRKSLQQGSERAYPPEFKVADVMYMGDEGGIACALEFDSHGPEQVHIVSITHLRIDPTHPLARQIGAYCKHRIKRIKKLDGRAMLP